MAVTRIQHVIGTTNNASPYAATIGAVAAGNVGCGFIYGNTTTTGWTVSDANNSYTVVTGTFGNDTADVVGIWPFYLVGVVAGTTTLTITHSPSDNLAFCFVEYHSTTGWTGFRNAASGANNTSNATLACSTSLGAAGDVVISACWSASDTAVTVHDGILTLLDTTTTPASTGTIAGDADILSASGAVTPSYTIATNTTGTGAIAAMAFTPSGATPDAFGSRIFRLQYNPWR